MLNFLAADTVNDEETPLSAGQKTLLLIRNVSGSPENAEVKAIPGPGGRTLDQNFQLGANEAAVMGPFGRDGFKQPNNVLHFIASATAIEFVVIRLP